MWDPFSLSLALEKKGSLLDYVGIFVALKPLYVLSFYCSSPRHPPTPSHVTPRYEWIRYGFWREGGEGKRRLRGFNLGWNSMPYVIFIWIRLWITRYAKDLCRGIKFDIQMDDTSFVSFPVVANPLCLDLDRSPRQRPTPPRSLFFSISFIFSFLLIYTTYLYSIRKYDAEFVGNFSKVERERGRMIRHEVYIK